MPSREMTLVYKVPEVTKALRKALDLPAGAKIEYLVKGQNQEGDWQAAYPLDHVFTGIRVSYLEAD